MVPIGIPINFQNEKDLEKATIKSKCKPHKSDKKIKNNTKKINNMRKLILGNNSDIRI